MAVTTLDSGIQVLSESIPGVRSAAVGVWVPQGSAHDGEDVLGASHLLEHMVFRGTQHRSREQIALALESLGGSLDAFTSREHTSFQARVLDEHLPQALDVLADLVLFPTLFDEDLELERRVVLEEISAVEDAPEDFAFELHGQHLWGRHPYGTSILGTRDTVSAIEGDSLRDLHRSRYGAGGMVVAATGNVAHDRVVELAAHYFRSAADGVPETPIPDPRSVEGREVHARRETAQTHIVTGTVTPPRADRRRYPLVLLAAAMGGGMSSRLFRRIREELGLAYSVYTFQSFYSRAGISGIYAGTRHDGAGQVIDAIREELATLAREGLPREDLVQVKSQVKGQIMLSLESPGARLYRLAGFALHQEPFTTLDELLSRIDRVTDAEVAESAAEFFHPDRQCLLRLGP
ncbi:MAG: insulinase family protein [Gammaproteobacteria bacterium]|nr:insulinase family protein [Gammaproteobacteria bacterium]MYK68742.1 insulinase family protein [Gammaproteobacteria bacterium]